MAEVNPQTVVLSGDGRRSSCRCSKGMGPQVVDVRKLYAQTGWFTYDPGYTSHGELHVEDHLHRRRRRHPAPSRLFDRGSGHGATSSRWLT